MARLFRPPRWRLLVPAGVAALGLGVVVGVPCWLYTHMPGSSHAGALPPPTPPEAALAARLRADVQHLASAIGERNLGRRPEALQQATVWIEQRMRETGLAPSRQVYQVDGVDAVNLEADKKGRESEIVVVGAHYDSPEGSPGANDNGSGVAALLAIAGALAPVELKRTVRLVFFTNEEPPYFSTVNMGSAVSAKRSRDRGERIVAMISLETMGYYVDTPGSQRVPAPLSVLFPSRGNFVAFVGSSQARALVRDAIGIFRQHAAFPSEGATPPAQVSGVMWSDHAPFEQEGYPAFMVTDTAPFRYPHYHEPSDTPEKLTYDAFARVVDGLTRVVTELANQ